MVAGVFGAGKVLPAGSPFDTHTMMFPIVLPLPRTSIGFGTGAVCFLAHTGSASMASGLRLGAVPANVTVPVMVDAAKATPGHTTAAASPAATKNLFAVLRILVSLIMATRRVDAAAVAHDWNLARLYTGLRHPINSRSLRVRVETTHAFSNASDSARRGSRSGTRACRRISQVAAATKHPPMARNAATSRIDGRIP